MRRALIALVALCEATTAQAIRPACVRPRDMRTVLRVALPAAIDGLAARCRAVLPDDAFLPGEGAALSARYRHEAPVDPARARAAIAAATGQDFGDVADDETVTRIANAFIANAIAERVSTRDCASIDGIVALAAPLRADAMVEAILIALQLAGPEQTGGLAICPPKDEVTGL